MQTFYHFADIRFFDGESHIHARRAVRNQRNVKIGNRRENLRRNARSPAQTRTDDADNGLIRLGRNRSDAL